MTEHQPSNKPVSLLQRRVVLRPLFILSMMATGSILILLAMQESLRAHEDLLTALAAIFVGAQYGAIQRGWLRVNSISGSLELHGSRLRGVADMPTEKYWVAAHIVLAACSLFVYPLLSVLVTAAWLSYLGCVRLPIWCRIGPRPRRN